MHFWNTGSGLVCTAHSSHLYSKGLIHRGQEKMATILLTTFSNTFFHRKILEFQLKFHWSLFLRVQVTTNQHCFRLWRGTKRDANHYLNQWGLSLPMRICNIQSWLVKGCVSLDPPKISKSGWWGLQLDKWQLCNSLWYGLINSKLHINKKIFFYITQHQKVSHVQCFKSPSWPLRDGLDLWPQLIYTLSWESQHEEI